MSDIEIDLCIAPDLDISEAAGERARLLALFDQSGVSAVGVRLDGTLCSQPALQLAGAAIKLAQARGLAIDTGDCDVSRRLVQACRSGTGGAA